MTALESLILSEYIRFLKYNKIEGIDVYKNEFVKYLELKNTENISDELKFFLNAREKAKVKKIGELTKEEKFPKR